ncbi:hypothetical protein ACFE04_004407 [Oxalis oulophora]
MDLILRPPYDHRTTKSNLRHYNGYVRLVKDDFEVDSEEHDSYHDSDVEDEILVEKEVETRGDIPPSNENEPNPEVEFLSMGPEGDGDVEDSSSEEEYFDD